MKELWMQDEFTEFKRRRLPETAVAARRGQAEDHELCPMCQSDNIMLENQATDIGGAQVYRYGECCSCKVTWRETYELKQFDIFKIPANW